MFRATCSVAAKTLGTLLILDLTAVHLHVFSGFLPLVGAMLFMAVATRHERSVLGVSSSSNTELLFYFAPFAAALLVQFVLFGRDSEEMLSMRRVSDVGEMQVVLESTDPAGTRVAILSSELDRYLTRSAKSRVDVVFEVTRDMGCLRDFRVLGFADLPALEFEMTHYVRGQNTLRPFNTPKWCP
jgi:hypothetical protein